MGELFWNVISFIYKYSYAFFIIFLWDVIQICTVHTHTYTHYFHSWFNFLPFINHAIDRYLQLLSQRPWFWWIYITNPLRAPFYVAQIRPNISRPNRLLIFPEKKQNNHLTLHNSLAYLFKSNISSKSLIKLALPAITLGSVGVSCKSEFLGRWRYCGYNLVTAV